MGSGGRESRLLVTLKRLAVTSLLQVAKDVDGEFSTSQYYNMNQNFE